MTTNATSTSQPDATVGAPTNSISLRWIGLGLFLAGCTVAAIFAFVIYPRQGMIEANLDVNGYGGLARFIVRGEGFSQSAGPTLRRAPLYPYLVALLLRLFQNNPDPHLPERLLYRPVLMAQCVIVGFNCLAVWTLGRRLFNAHVGLLAGGLCLVSPMVMRYVGAVEVETLMSLLITLMALTGYNLYQHPTFVNSILFALTCALATLTKSVTLLYPMVFLAALACINSRASFKKIQNQNSSEMGSLPPQPLSFRASALLVIGVYGLCLLPWAARNYRVSSGRFLNINSNGPAEFLRGYYNVQPKFYLLRQDFGGADPTRLSWEQEASGYEAALIKPHGLDYPAMERSATPDPALPAMTYVDYELRKEAVESEEMKRGLLQQPGRFFRKFVIQLATFWYIVETRTKSLIVGAIALVTLSFALFGWLRARGAHPGVFVIVCTVAYFNIVYAIFLSFARYSMPLYPILLILTAYGISEAWQTWKQHGKI